MACYDCPNGTLEFQLLQSMWLKWQQITNTDEYTKYLLFSLMLFAILFYVNQNPQKFFKEDW